MQINDPLRRVSMPAVVFCLLGTFLCACGPSKTLLNVRLGDPSLEAWMSRQSEASRERLLRNVSSGATAEKKFDAKYIEEKCRIDLVREAIRAGNKSLRFEAGQLLQTVTAKPGSVVAAPAGQPPEPDYFFHWTRDSALAVDALITLSRSGPPSLRAEVLGRIGEFLAFTKELQASQAPEGLGEPRCNADGTRDFLKWSRPQHDGPALRALTVLRHMEDVAPAAAAALLQDVVRPDLDFIAANWGRDAFDLWEEYAGQDYYARVVQMAALEAGARQDPERSGRYGEEAGNIAAALEAQWLPDQGYYGFGVGTRVYWDGVRKEKPGRNLDSAVLLAAVHGKRAAGRHSVLDDRILSTAVKLEDQAERLYPINRERARDEGAALGRYEGDAYHGGNPWQLITLGYAELHYRAAAALAAGGRLDVTPWDMEFLSRALKRSGFKGRPAAGAALPEEFRRPLAQGLILRGDDLMRTIRRHTPASGELAEQFDKETGLPVSGRDLSWSHGAFLTAVDARGSALKAYARLAQAPRP